jgi:hypothetical protein
VRGTLFFASNPTGNFFVIDNISKAVCVLNHGVTMQFLAVTGWWNLWSAVSQRIAYAISSAYATKEADRPPVVTAYAL